MPTREAKATARDGRNRTNLLETINPDQFEEFIQGRDTMMEMMLAMEMKMENPKQRLSVKKIGIALAIVAAVVAPWATGLLGWAGYGPANWTTTKVTGKVVDKVVKGHSYRVMFQPDGSDKVEVLTCEDSAYFLNWNSGDDFANLNRGDRYQLKVTGYRSPFRSRFRNVVDYAPSPR